MRSSFVRWPHSFIYIDLLTFSYTNWVFGFPWSFQESLLFFSGRVFNLWGFYKKNKIEILRISIFSPKNHSLPLSFSVISFWWYIVHCQWQEWEWQRMNFLEKKSKFSKFQFIFFFKILQIETSCEKKSRLSWNDQGEPKTQFV